MWEKHWTLLETKFSKIKEIMTFTLNLDKACFYIDIFLAVSWILFGARDFSEGSSVWSAVDLLIALGWAYCAYNYWKTNNTGSTNSNTEGK